jgi:hypothetical protein
MEDLREVGQNSLGAINKLGASDVGDLVLGIGNLIEELHDTPEDKRADKLEHLRGLFREFAHGEEYEFRDERLEPAEPDDPYMVTPGSSQQPLPFPAISGMFSGTIGPIASDVCSPQPMVTGIPSIDDAYKASLAEDEESFDDEEEVEKERPWWKPEIKIRWKSQEEQLDDEDTN